MPYETVESPVLPVVLDSVVVRPAGSVTLTLTLAPLTATPPLSTAVLIDAVTVPLPRVGNV